MQGKDSVLEEFIVVICMCSHCSKPEGWPLLHPCFQNGFKWKAD